ncbi:hypothetical protein [Helicobacter sp. UBA3407]|uniref:hypothetical protein n=1 Tax=Helicobacter TaxID=209 RepID=UPI00261F3C44|nr:hypothetical protein [Helicobacter sp. UBA3407]
MLCVLARLHRSCSTHFILARTATQFFHRVLTKTFRFLWRAFAILPCVIVRMRSVLGNLQSRENRISQKFLQYNRKN